MEQAPFVECVNDFLALFLYNFLKPLFHICILCEKFDCVLGTRFETAPILNDFLDVSSEEFAVAVSPFFLVII